MALVPPPMLVQPETRAAEAAPKKERRVNMWISLELLICGAATKAADGDQQDRGGPTRHPGARPAIVEEELS